MGNFQEAMEHIAKGLAILVMEGMGEQMKSLAPQASGAFNLKDGAKYIGIGKSTLHKYMKAGRIKTHMVGGRPKYYREDLDQLLRELKKASQCPQSSTARTATAGFATSSRANGIP